jgi:ankyrin repeat protein
MPHKARFLEILDTIEQAEARLWKLESDSGKEDEHLLEALQRAEGHELRRVAQQLMLKIDDFQRTYKKEKEHLLTYLHALSGELNPLKGIPGLQDNPDELRRIIQALQHEAEHLDPASGFFTIAGRCKEIVDGKFHNKDALVQLLRGETRQLHDLVDHDRKGFSDISNAIKLLREKYAALVGQKFGRGMFSPEELRHLNKLIAETPHDIRHAVRNAFHIIISKNNIREYIPLSESLRGSILELLVQKNLTELIELLLDRERYKRLLPCIPSNALQLATKHNNERIVHALLAVGTKVNQTFYHPLGYAPAPTPLFTAVQNQNVSLVRLFLDKDADPTLPAMANTLNDTTFNIETPLIAAVKLGNVEIARLLLDTVARGDINYALPSRGAHDAYDYAYGGATALIIAALCKHTDIVRMLLSYKAELEPHGMLYRRMQDGLSIFGILMSDEINHHDHKNFEIFSMLLQRQPRIIDTDGKISAIVRSYRGKLAPFLTLIQEKGYQLETVDAA